MTEPLSRLPDDPLPPVADVDFPIVLRGYDRMAVDAYVRHTAQLVAEMQATRSPDAAVRRALERVGEEVSGILQRAHETAEQITAQSRREADERLEGARREADGTLEEAHRKAAGIVADAERRLRELDAETDRIWAERHQIVEDARMLAGQLLSVAEAAVERFPADEPLAGGAGPADTVEASEPIAALEEAAAGEPEDVAEAAGEPEDVAEAAGEPEETAQGAGEPEETAQGANTAEVGDSAETAIMPPLDAELP